MQKLSTLNTLLSQANYKGFWNTLDSDDLYADLIADVSGFEELMRVRIAVTVGQSCREVERKVLEGWLSLTGSDFDRFVLDICSWKIDNTVGGGKGGVVVVPVNKENEAKGTVVRENVQFDREFSAFTFSLLFIVRMCGKTRPGSERHQADSFLVTEFARIIKRAYEQPA